MDLLQTALLSWRQYYGNLIAQYEQELSCLPEGSLSCETLRGVKRFYLYLGRTRRYLSRSADSQLLDQMIRKRFIYKSLPILRKNLKAIDFAIGHYTNYDPSKLVPKLNEFFPDFVQRYGLPNTPIDVNAWLVEEIPTNQGWPEQKIHLTARGEYTRSKSEVYIANSLYFHQLPYRYERILNLGGVQVSPDFEILRPRDEELIYWEHFGLLNNPKYIEKMEQKLHLYHANGICLWKNLIITFDTPEGALDTQNIESIINAFLL